MTYASFALKRPQVQSSTVIFASPHSGRAYPREFLRRSVLDDLAIRSSEDAFVDMFIDGATEAGSPVLRAELPRAYIDLNRAYDELDPAVIEGVSRSNHNPRISSGLGVIPRVVSNGRGIYRGKISRREAEARIRDVWWPYHDALQQILNETRTQFGEAILVDFHSMPHEASDAASQPGFKRPEVVLGDRFGASCRTDLVDQIETIFQSAGLRVSRNTPFAGAFIVQHYGRPSKRQHAIQVEIDRALYMNEAQVQPNGNFRAFQTLMRKVTREIAELGGTQMIPMAAE